MTENGSARKPDIHKKKKKKKNKKKERETVVTVPNIIDAICHRTLTNHTQWDKIHRILVFLELVSY